MKGHEQSRRDDMEALGYVWLYLLRGSLPWIGLDAPNRRQKYQMICQVKQATSVEALCAGFPDEFVRYFSDVRALPFTAAPNYAEYRAMFRKLLLSMGYVYDYVYDWTIDRPCPAEVPPRPPPEHLSDRAKIPAKPSPSALQQYSFSKQDAVPKVPRFSVAAQLSVRVSDHSEDATTDESDQPALAGPAPARPARECAADRALTEIEAANRRQKPIARAVAAEDASWSIARKTSGYGTRPAPRAGSRATDGRRGDAAERVTAVMSGDTSESFHSGKAAMGTAAPREGRRAAGTVVAPQRAAHGYASHFEDWMLEKANKCRLRH
jgi:hypothetical protein